MNSQHIADIDHHNPKDITEKTFKVCSYHTKGSRVWIDDVLDETFSTEADAKEALLAIKDFKGEELDVLEFDEDSDETVVFCAEWDEDQKRYVEA
ncbi:hypothetical protein Rleg2_1117 [Rhizobium leguminosarum bv. trifolii WSM2304]|uniref:Uncharacterized protein n=1 Tax=Rhizobium leguminosarum bv. trifolii (strain WSM2304) TaxID=395492 RepID=A0ABF7QKC9_RHILW|nr:hypothetical protein [Rhizobium leguminosarum]ACI54411.1 hypothetical protein Rleg2_1117 [Rhizobium leguminosarum bv. trifolii WSM2304]